jgi:hypothetical protein
MEGPTSQKTNSPPKSANHKGTIKFPNPLLLSWEAYQIMKGGEKKEQWERTQVQARKAIPKVGRH